MVIKNGKIFTMEEKQIECGYVRTKGKRIEEVGSMSSFKYKEDGERVLDVNGAWVLPGLIESHAHIGITEEKWGIIGDDSNEETTPVTASLRAIDAVNPMDPAFHDAIEAGILFSITTDHPVALIQTLPLCAGLAVKYGLPVEEGLKAITINAARICRVDDRVGSLKKGKDADIVVFSGNPMEVFTQTLCTIIDGEIIYENFTK